MRRGSWKYAFYLPNKRISFSKGVGIRRGEGEGMRPYIENKYRALKQPSKPSINGV
jgi:hypothetical protein